MEEFSWFSIENGKITTNAKIILKGLDYEEKRKIIKDFGKDGEEKIRCFFEYDRN